MICLCNVILRLCQPRFHAFSASPGFDFVFSELAKRLSVKSIAKMTYFVSSETLNTNQLSFTCLTFPSHLYTWYTHFYTGVQICTISAATEFFHLSSYHCFQVIIHCFFYVLTAAHQICHQSLQMVIVCHPQFFNSQMCDVLQQCRSSWIVSITLPLHFTRHHTFQISISQCLCKK